MPFRLFVWVIRMRQIIAVFLAMFLPAAASAQVAGSLSEQAMRLIVAAESKEGGARAQSKLAHAYYYGLDGMPESHAEAYYWFSVCVQSLQNVKGFSDQFKNLEEMSDNLAEETPSKDKQEGRLMQGILVDPFLKRGCEDFATILKKELPAAEREEADRRLQNWIAAHPTPVSPPASPEEKQKAELTRRLYLEVNSGGIDAAHDIEGIRKLIAAGANVNYKQGELLPIAVGKSWRDIAEALIDAGLTDKAALQKAIRVAGERDDAETIRMLVRKIDALDESTLSNRLLVRKGGVLDESTLSKGLHGAMASGDIALVEEFLQRGAKLGDDTSALGRLVAKLVADGRKEMVRRYISLGGNVNLTEYNIGTPLHVVANKGDAEMFDILIKAGADINALSRGDRTPLITAVSGRNIEIIKKLIDAGAAPKTPTDTERLMSEAIASKSRKVIDYLLGLGLTFTESQTALLAMCAIEEKECPGGKTAYSGPPDCKFDICVPSQKQNNLAAPVDHPLNGINTEALGTFLKGTSEEKTSLIKDIIENPAQFNPLVLNDMARSLFNKYRDDEAIFWRIAAEMRAEGDKKICPSDTPAYFKDRYLQGLFAFDYYKRREPEKVLSIIPKVAEWDAKTPYDYNVQWGTEQSHCLSPERYNEIRSEIRSHFRLSFDQGPTPFDQQNDQKMDELLPLAESGDLKAQLTLARCYESPQQCRIHAADTVRMTTHQVEQEKAAAGKSSVTITALNLENEYKPKAVYWYEKAMAQGSEAAIAALAFAYYGGGLGTQDEEKAREMALHLLELGSPRAFNLMAAMSPQSEGKWDVINYAWQMTAQAAGVAVMSDQAVSHYKTSLSDQDFAEAQAKADEYIKKYLPLFGSKKSK